MLAEPGYDPYIYGGYVYVTGSGSGTATGNTITINGNPTLAASTRIYGGYIHLSNYGAGRDLFSGNTLNLNSSTAISQVDNMEFINFGNIGNANIGILNTREATGSAVTATPFVKLNTQGNTITFAGQITGSWGIEKNGAGVLILSNATSNYSGGTNINNGLINFTSGNNLGTGKITLNGGACNGPPLWISPTV